MNTLTQRTKKFLEVIIGHPENYRYLLGVSGGPDSMAMAKIFQELGYKMGIAHCNFLLRETEAPKETELVRSWADQNGFPLFISYFDTSQYARRQKISIQMAARELRYQWFEKLRHEEGYDFICTAHQLDDQKETFFINLLRGTGIKGLRAMEPLSEKILHPLLFATRDEIMEFIESENIPYRIDSSNLQTKYLRNKIRLEIFPLLDKIYPGWNTHFEHTLERLSFAADVFEDYLREHLKERIKMNDDEVRVDFSSLENSKHAPAFLYEIIKDFNFNYPQAMNLAEALKNNTRKKFLSTSHCIYTKGSSFCIQPFKLRGQESYFISSIKNTSDSPIAFNFKLYSKDDFPGFQKNSCYAYFDYDQLTFPLQLRHWRQGDYIQPLGMKGQKKISDLLIQNKIPLYRKKDIWLLCDKDEVLWVVGLRTSEHAKVTDITDKILQLEVPKEYVDSLHE
jgi:tRNA(Ile)-lysidine synthase